MNSFFLPLHHISRPPPPPPRHHADLDHNLDVPREFLVDVSSCYKALRRFKNNKSPGPSAVPNKIWKEFASELSPVVTDIYNASLGQGFSPYQIKESLVTPLPKCSPPKCINDLRPVTLTSQIAKIFEGFTLAPLFNQVIDKIDRKQFALLGRSTTHALVYLLLCILEALDNGHCYARILFTDFSKRFDLADHSVLVSELRDLGVHEALIRWIGPQQVKIGSALSNSVIPRGGIPQGTRLARLLFAVLVNNLVKDWKTGVKYVDDMSVLDYSKMFNQHTALCSEGYLFIC